MVVSSSPSQTSEILEIELFVPARRVDYNAERLNHCLQSLLSAIVFSAISQILMSAVRSLTAVI